MWAVGTLAVAVLGVALAELLALRNPSRSMIILAATGIFAALISIGFLLWGNQRRYQLINEFHRSALDLTAQVEAQDRKWKVDEDGEWLVPIPDHDEAAGPAGESSGSEGLTRSQVLDLLGEYERGLSRLGAFGEAHDTRVQAEWLRYRYAGNPNVLPGDRV
jgi:hypothetical protein